MKVQRFVPSILLLPWFVKSQLKHENFQKNMGDTQAQLDPLNYTCFGCVMNLRQNFITREISSHTFYRETGQTWEKKCKSSFVPFCMGDSPWVIYLMSGWWIPSQEHDILETIKGPRGIKRKTGRYHGGTK
jgi:hypothetical protein